MNKKIIQEDEGTVDSSLIFDIHNLGNRAPGASISYKLDGIEPDLSKYNIHLKAPIEGEIEIMKVETEYNVAIKNFKTTVELICEKCLEKFDFIIEIPYTEMQFLVSTEAFENRFDFFYANTKNHTVDIEEFLRQEIILHFPLVAVCSPHCKGINLN